MTDKGMINTFRNDRQEDTLTLTLSLQGRGKKKKGGYEGDISPLIVLDS